MFEPAFAPRAPLAEAARKRPPMDIQSLMFSRKDGWTVDSAKKWAKKEGFKYGKAHVTDQYIRLRQFDPKGLKVKRTITLGRGIRAVVAREEDMAAKRRRKQSTEARRPRRRRAAGRRTREATTTVQARRPRRRRARESTTVQARRRPRRVRAATTVQARRRRAPAAGYVMESRRRRPRRRHATEAWRGNKGKHSQAAKKGWARRRRAGTAHRRRRARETTVYEARRRAPRRRRRSAETYEARYRGPKRRRRRSAEYTMEARRHGRRRRTYEARSRGTGMDVAELAVAIVAGGLGFVLADGLDRFLATYDPSSTAAKPTDKFTSDGTGTLANTLNVAATPNMYRIGAAVLATAAPAVASAYISHPFVKSTLEGMAVGTGVNLFRLLWNNVLMPMLTPKDTSTASLQKNIIARLYPAEVAAHLNLTNKQTAVTSTGSGALSGPPGVGSPDVGPFALAGESPYPDAAQALRSAAGMGDQFPTLQNLWGTGGPGSNYPTAQQVMGVGDVAAALQKAYPTIEIHLIHDIARHVHHHMPKSVPVAPSPAAAAAAGATPVATTPPPAPSPPPAAVVPAPVPSGTTHGFGQPPAYMPGPPPGPGPGPQVAPDAQCACLGDNNPFLGFIGDAEEKDLFFNTQAA